MKTKRLPGEIKKQIYEILILNPSISMTKLMQEANLNYEVLNKYMSELRNKNFISGIRKELRITNQGLKDYNSVIFKEHFAQVYDKLQK